MDPITMSLVFAAGCWMIKKGNQIGRSKNRSNDPDITDENEANFLKERIRKKEMRESVIEYCDHVRKNHGHPRRPGVNADLLAKFPRGD